MCNLIVLDIETQKDFHEVGGRRGFGNLGVSVVGVYDYTHRTYRAYEEHELAELEALIAERDGVVGFNVLHFDYTVMQPYFTRVRLEDVYTVDLMKELEEVLGFRVSLNAVVRATLGEVKSGHGREAAALYRAGKLDELKAYCLGDVRLTKELYEHGSRNGTVSFVSRTGRERAVEARWAHSVKRHGELRSLLRTARDEQRVASLRYRSPGNEEATWCDVEVRAVRGAVVDAYCHLRQGPCRFRLERIENAVLKEKANTQQALF